MSARHLIHFAKHTFNVLLLCQAEIENFSPIAASMINYSGILFSIIITIIIIVVVVTVVVIIIFIIIFFIIIIFLNLLS